MITASLSCIIIFLQSQLDTRCKACYAITAKPALHNLLEMRIDLKTRIKALRKEKKMSQEELAMAVGTTRQTITSIEIGKYTASLGLAYKISRFFGKRIEDVFDLSEFDNDI